MASIAGLLILALVIWMVRHRMEDFGRVLRRSVSLPLIIQAMPATALTVQPTKLGLNLTSVKYYGDEHAFANLTLGDLWRSASSEGWKDMGAEHIGPAGALKSLPPGVDAVLMLVRPDTGPNGAKIRCTYRGKADITAKGSARAISSSPGKLTFDWVNDWKEGSVWLQVHEVDASAPITDLDCRKTTTPPGQRFETAFVDGLIGYKVLRFMDWQNSNANGSVRWEARHTPASQSVVDADGVAIEDMIALANQTRNDAWFSMPWNADDEYLMRFAQMAHDGLAPGHRVYVEVGNEVWNTMFPVAQQAVAEGTQRFSGDGDAVRFHRYAERTIEVMKIWERVFSDQPSRLVRVVSSQNVLPRAAEMILAMPDLSRHVDALATAPYFGFDVMEEGETQDLDEIIRRLNDRVAQTITKAEENKAVAQRYGKRYIAYEAGQHVVLNNLALEQRIQRDPRMHDLYIAYIDKWRAHVGDVMMIFASVGPIGGAGAWGIAEHSGQPLSETPKLRAVLEERAR